MDRITNAQLHERVANVNRRLIGSGRAVVVERRNGYIALDEYSVTDDNQFDACVRTIMIGTKREVADFLHAMMVGIDLSRA